MTHDTKGLALNERVWRLFEKAGFQTEPSSHSSAEHVVLVAKKERPLDLFATDPELKVSIVASNKSGAIKGWSKELQDLRAIATAAKADAAIFIVTGVKISGEHREQAASLKIEVWDEHQLDYFDDSCSSRFSPSRRTLQATSRNHNSCHERRRTRRSFEGRSLRGDMADRWAACRWPVGKRMASSKSCTSSWFTLRPWWTRLRYVRACFRSTKLFAPTATPDITSTTV
jgi:hypothetical protein